jgi:3-deoxy-manno-octulosonate cytidylyltransferase (CMP-KDO synthetase)
MAAAPQAEVVVATDHQTVLEAVEGWGGKALLSPSTCQSGTERVAAIAHQLRGELVINLQADEPFMDPAVLRALIEAFGHYPVPVDMLTPVYPLADAAMLSNPMKVKVARALDGTALYFSRSPIPHCRGQAVENWPLHGSYWVHIGVYAVAKTSLLRYPTLRPGPLEQLESLEQLRLLENGWRIGTVPVQYTGGISVDVPEDLEKARLAWQQANPPKLA